NGTPLWSPDGAHIAYFAAWAHSYSLNVAAKDGSHDGTVAPDGGFGSYGPGVPSWSADAQRLAFEDGSDVLHPPQGIFSSRADGSDRRLLVPHAVEPAYSPDGTKLAYVALRDFQSAGVYVSNADGSDARLVFAGPATWPEWSPNSEQIAYGGPAGSALLVSNADGSDERVVSRGGPARIGYSPPRWSPGGHAHRVHSRACDRRRQQAVQIVDRRRTRRRQRRAGRRPSPRHEPRRAARLATGRASAFGSARFLHAAVA